MNITVTNKSQRKCITFWLWVQSGRHMQTQPDSWWPTPPKTPPYSTRTMPGPARAPTANQCTARTSVWLWPRWRPQRRTRRGSSCGLPVASWWGRQNTCDTWQRHHPAAACRCIPPWRDPADRARRWSEASAGSPSPARQTQGSQNKHHSPVCLKGHVCWQKLKYSVLTTGAHATFIADKGGLWLCKTAKSVAETHQIKVQWITR